MGAPQTHAHEKSARRIPLWVRRALVVVWIAFIWSRSLFPGPASSPQSNFVAALLQPLLEAMGIHEWSQMTFLVRKTVHFLEYAVLGDLLPHEDVGEPGGPACSWAMPLPARTRRSSCSCPAGAGRPPTSCSTARGWRWDGPDRDSICAPSTSQVRMCVAHCGKTPAGAPAETLRRWCRLVTAMRVEPEPEIHIVAAPPSRQVARIAS